MILALKILLTVAAIALILLLVCIMVPLIYEFSLTGTQHKIQFKFICRSFPGTMIIKHHDNHTDTELRILNRPGSTQPKKKSSASLRRSAITKPPRNFSPFLMRKAIKDRALLKRCLQFIAAVWNKIKPRHLAVDACIGCSEPHYTGWIMAAAAVLQADNSYYSIHIEGNWLESGLDGEVLIAGKFIPAAILWQILKLLASSEARPYYRLYRNRRNVAARAQTA
ncbi:MAG TPA: hypothetical protein PKI17_03420 [Syntrophomonas sp.]|nr:hypothetical protein [Syntrophomonas sp.]